MMQMEIKFAWGILWQCLAGCVASLCFVGGAASYVWVNPVLDLLRSPASPVPMTAAQSSWVATLPELGTIFTAVPSGCLADYFGRKPLLMAIAPLNVLAWVVIYVTSDIYILLTMRLIQGLLLGVSSTVLPLYLSEIAQPSIRGALGNLFVLSFNFGQLFEYVAGSFCDYNTLIWVSTLPFIIFMLGFYWFEESPYYLLMKGREDEAKQSLMSFRDSQWDTAGELATMAKSMQEERENRGSWKDIVGTRQGRKALLIVTVTSISVFMSGYNALASYSSETFTRTLATGVSPAGATMAMGGLLTVAALLTSLIIDPAGRRFTLFWSHTLCALLLAPVAVFYYIQDHTDIDVSSWSILPVIGIILSPAAMCGAITAVRVYQAELFSTSTRGLASGVATVVLGAASSLTLLQYQTLQEADLMYVNFAIFSGSCVLGAIFIWFFAPETKGKSLEEVHRML